MNQAENIHPTDADEVYQVNILQGVSRTFALTIPQLPDNLARVVGNAYLLCRIADTIEDDKDLPFNQKLDFSNRFISVVKNEESPSAFSKALHPLLSNTATQEEKDLIANTESVLRITHSFNSRQRAALERCIRIMAQGMSLYQETNVKNGLQNQRDMDRYCYFVAGVVGEMVTDLFCDFSNEIDKHREQLMPLAISFGQGLQMTNILKDIWDDQKRDMCWLPQDVFIKYGSDLRGLNKKANGKEFQAALGHLTGVARTHLNNALKYTLLIPRSETGIRRFCLWALGMAVLTLRKINNNRDFLDGQDVKITRNSVKATILTTSALSKSDFLLNTLFNAASTHLPSVALAPDYFETTGKYPDC